MTRLALAAAALALAACTPDPALLGPPRTTDPNGNNAMRELEPPNSLPRGFTTNHAFTPATGVFGRTTTP